MILPDTVTAGGAPGAARKSAYRQGMQVQAAGYAPPALSVTLSATNN